MRVRLADASDQEAWDHHVSGSPNGNYHQLYGWGEVRALAGWEPLRVLVEREEGLLGTVQLFSRRIPGLASRLFYAPRGPVLAEAADAAVCQALLCEASAQATARGGVLLRIDPEPASWGLPVERWLPACGFRPLARRWTYWNWTTYSLRTDLQRSPEELLASFGHSRRKHLRRAQRGGVQVVLSTSREEIRTLHTLSLHAAQRNHFAQHSLAYFEACWDHLVARGLGFLAIAYHDGVPAAAGLSLAAGPRVWNVYGAPNPALRSTCAYEALSWGEMRLFRERGFRWLDLGPGGAGMPDADRDPVYRFKLGFSPEMVHYPGYFDRPLRPLAYRALQFVEGCLPPAERVVRSSRRALRVLTRTSPLFTYGVSGGLELLREGPLGMA